MSDQPAPQHLSVAAAAEAAGVPRRTLYRAVTRGDVASTKGDRGLVVDLEAVRAWATARDDDQYDEGDGLEDAGEGSVPSPPMVPISPLALASAPVPELPGLPMPGTEVVCAVAQGGDGTPLGTDAGTVPASTVDAGTYQRVYVLFAAGLSPREVVVREGLHPDVVDDVRAAWDRQGRPSVFDSSALAELRLTLQAIDDQVVAAQAVAADAVQVAAEAVGLVQTTVGRLAHVEAQVAQQADALLALSRRLDSRILASLER